MKQSKYWLLITRGHRSDLSTIVYHWKVRKRHTMLTTFLILAFTVIGARADQLWNNGNTDGSSSLSWGQYSSMLDDFYVPGGGWFIESATTRGFFLNDGEVINDVKVSIWPHDMDTSEPDGDNNYSLAVKDFDATPTGSQHFGYDEIEINVMFDSPNGSRGDQRPYLDGQRFYWIEFKVETQDGSSDFHFLARQDTLHNPARIRIGNSGGDTYQNDDDANLSYALYGDAVKLLDIGASDSLKSASKSEEKVVHSLY